MMEKDRKFKTIGLVAVLVAVVGLSIAFAALSRTLTINGTAKQEASTWLVVWEKLTGENFVTTGTAEVDEDYPTITNNGTNLNLGVITLKKPGDKVTYRVNMANNGDIDAMVTGVTGVTVNNTYVEYSVKYLDNNTNITAANGRLLAAGAKKLVLIEVKFKESVTNEEYNHANGIEVDLNGVSITYSQADSTAQADPEPAPNPWATSGLTSSNVVYSTSSSNVSYVCPSGYMSDSNNVIMTLGDDGSLYTGWDGQSYTPEAALAMQSQSSAQVEDNLFMIPPYGIMFEFTENGGLNVYNKGSSVNTVSALKAVLNDPSNINATCTATVQN